MRNFKDIIVEKLKVTKNSFDFTWDEFIEALYKYEHIAFQLEDLPNVEGYFDLPEVEYERKKIKIYALAKYDSYTENAIVNVLYSYDGSSLKNDIEISSLDALNDILDQKLISEIYDNLSK